MTNKVPLTIVGNLTADPELRYTQNGLAVANFTVAHTERVFDRATNESKDGDTVFLRGSVWRDLAEHVAASLKKGQRVVVIGSLKQRDYEDKDGNKRTAYEIEVDEIGPSLRFGTADFKRSATSTQEAAAPAAAQAPAAPAQAEAPAPAAAQAPAQAAPAQVEDVQF